MKDITETFYFRQSSRALQARVKMKECREGGEEVMDSEKERDVIIILYYIFGLAHTAPIVPR